MEMTLMGWWWVTWVLGALPLMLGLVWWWNDLWYTTTLKARCLATGTRLPPGYMGIPFFGELATFLWYFKVLRRPDDYVNAKRHRYGDGVGMYRTYLFGFPTIIACTPETNRFIFQSDDKFPYRWPTKDLVGHNSLVSIQGERHTRMRRFVSAAVNQPNALRQIALLVQPNIADSLQSWAQKGTVVTYEEVKKMTFANIIKLFAGIEPGPTLDDLRVHFHGMVKGLRSQPFNFPGTTYHHALKCRKELIAIFREELEKKKKKQNKNGSSPQMDLMDGLMQLKDEEGTELTDDEVLDNIVSLILAGYESTTISLTWAVYYLAKFPEVLRKLREENVAFHQTKEDEFISWDEVSQLKYTNKVVEEIVRLANVAIFVFRGSDKDVEYQGYKIPKGWKVLCWLRYVHTDPRNFDDPLCFNPDRSNPDQKHLAFGAGARSCVASMFAKMQIALFLHHLSIGYKWELINPDAKISHLPHPKPADGVKISITKM